MDNSINSLFKTAIQAYQDIFDEFCKDMLNRLIEQSSHISLDLEEKEDVK